MSKSRFRLEDVIKKYQQVSQSLPHVLAKDTENYFLASFTKQSFNHEAWKEVKRRIEGTPEYKYPKKKKLSRRTKPILVGTGRLRRAVSNSIRTVTFKKIDLIVDVPYAIVHNEGDGVPKRQFVGQTPELTELQKHIITREINKVWPR